MDMNEFKQFAVKLAMLVDSFEKRGDRMEQTVVQAAQSIMQVSKNSESVAERTTHKALTDFRETAATQLGNGLRQPVQNAEQTLQASMQSLHALLGGLEQRQRDTNRAHKLDAWKVFIASSLASLVMLGGSVYAIVQARQESANAHWISGVNAAIDAGRLAPCGDEGLCAYVNKQWLRLDQAEAPRGAARKKK